MTLGDLLYYIITERPIKVLVPEHTEALRLIATMSNNINQIAHAVNTDMLIDQHISQTTLNKLNEILGKLDALLIDKATEYGEVQ